MCFPSAVKGYCAQGWGGNYVRLMNHIWKRKKGERERKKTFFSLFLIFFHQAWALNYQLWQLFHFLFRFLNYCSKKKILCWNRCFKKIMFQNDLKSQKTVHWDYRCHTISFENTFFPLVDDVKIKIMQYLHLNVWAIKTKPVAQVVATFFMTWAYTVSYFRTYF